MSRSRSYSRRSRRSRSPRYSRSRSHTRRSRRSRRARSYSRTSYEEGKSARDRAPIYTTNFRREREAKKKQKAEAKEKWLSERTQQRSKRQKEKLPKADPKARAPPPTLPKKHQTGIIKSKMVLSFDNGFDEGEQLSLEEVFDKREPTFFSAFSRTKRPTPFNLDKTIKVPNPRLGMYKQSRKRKRVCLPARPRKRPNRLQNVLRHKMSIYFFTYEGRRYEHHPLTQWLITSLSCEKRSGISSHLTKNEIKHAHAAWSATASQGFLGTPYNGAKQGSSAAVFVKKGSVSEHDFLVSAARWAKADSPSEGICNHSLPPLSRPQAEFFVTTLDKVDRETSDALLEICADFVCNDSQYIETVAFHSSLKPSSRRTYTSGLRQLIRWVVRNHPDAPANLDPFTLVTYIRGNGLGRKAVMKFLMFRLISERVNYRTVCVNLAAINWAWRVAKHEKLIHEGDLFFKQFLLALKKKYQTEAKGSDMLGRLECVAFFAFLQAFAEGTSEELFTLASETAKTFMARESEILDLRTEDVFFSEEIIDFQPTEMVTLVFQDPKSGTESKPQTVSFELNDTSHGKRIRDLFKRIAEAKGPKETKYFFSPYPKRKMNAKRFRAFIKEGWAAFIKAPEFAHLAKKKITFHSFRSSGICELFHSGMQIDIIRLLARHAQWSTTFESYVKKSRRFTRCGC